MPVPCLGWLLKRLITLTLTLTFTLTLTLPLPLTLPTYQAGEVEFKANKEGLVHGAVRKSRGVGWRGGAEWWACARRGGQDHSTPPSP